MSVTASRGSRSPTSASARSSRACACSCRPSRCSTPAQAATSRTCRLSASGGASARLSSSTAWLSAKRPVAASAPERASWSSTRSSAGADAGSSRSAAPNQRSALAGARCAAAARPRGGAPPRPGRRAGRTARHGAREQPRACPARRGRRRCARARPAASRPASTRRPRAGRAGGGSGSASARPWRARGRGAGARRAPRSPRRRSSPAAAAATSGSKGSPATAAPSSTRRAGSEEARAPRRARQRRSAAPRCLPGTWRRRALPRPSTLQRAGELLQVEGVAAARLVETVGVGSVGGVGQELAGLVARERRQVDADERAGAVGALERGREPLGHLAGPHGQRHEHRCSRGPVEQAAEQLDRRRVGPVQVVQNQHERLGRGEQLEQRPYGAMAPVALVLDPVPSPAARRWSDGKTWASSAPTSSSSASRRRGSRPRTYSSSASTKTQNGRSRSSSEAEPPRTRWPRSVGACPELCEQPGLADPGLADQLDGRGAAVLEVGEQAVERAELRGPSDQMLANGHSVRPRRG